MLPKFRSILKALPWMKIIMGLIVAFFVYLAWLVWYTMPDPRGDKAEREQANTAKNIVNDVTELNPVQTKGIIVPHTIEEISAAVRANDRVSIGGGRNSMGGQTASERAVQIDMREYTKILSFSTSTKEITVQAGIRWRDIQDHINPHGLSVKIMQTYSNFTVGGSLSVNVHGRYIGLGPVIMSVKSFRIVLADGSIVEVTPTKNTDIFYSAIGGMGGIGVISDVTLELADNVNVERSRVKMSTGEYYEFFKNNVRDTGNVLFHNGDMYPPDFEEVSAVSWTVTDKEPTTEDRLIPRKEDYWTERFAWTVMSEWPFGRAIREHVFDNLIYNGQAPVHTRNYEASYDIAELEPQKRDKSTYVLQEYFVPVENFDVWVPKMKKVFNDNKVNVLNVSIRHAMPDPGAKLAWARKESFAFVVYYKQGTDQKSQEEVGKWTRQMIEQVLTVGGSYYLPYQPWATEDQILRAYPHRPEFFDIKKRIDPTNKFTNKLWDKYYSDAQVETVKERSRVFSVAGDTKEYFRAHDNTYLSIPEWYIVYSADEYGSVLRDGLPSSLHYFEAVSDFWGQYRKAKDMTSESWNDNSGYTLVLRVIGVSFAFENIFKGVYENTIGRVSELLSSWRQVPEDKYAAKVAKEYADMIYDYPWYDFDFWAAFKGVWKVKKDHSYSFAANLRRLERKLFLSLEYGVKTIYAGVIKMATHSKFGVQDDVIGAVVSRDGGATLEVLTAKRYQPFTRALLEEFNKADETGRDFVVMDIAGNQRITLQYLDDIGAEIPSRTTEIVREREFYAMIDGKELRKERVVVEASVSDLFIVYKELKAREVSVGHFYDY